MASRLLNPIKIISQTGKTHSGTVIFLHGSGTFPINSQNTDIT